jgi:hypothetical protein
MSREIMKEEIIEAAQALNDAMAELEQALMDDGSPEAMAILEKTIDLVAGDDAMHYAEGLEEEDDEEE